MKPLLRHLFCVIALACAVPAVAADGSHTWIATWSAPPVETLEADRKSPDGDLSDQTIRMVVRISSGGTRLRLRLSNELSDAPRTIDSVHVSLATPSGEPAPGTDRVVRFAGSDRAQLPPFAPLVSDPVSLAVPGLGRLVVTMHVPGPLTGLTVHPMGISTASLAPGDQTARAQLENTRSTMTRYVLSGVEVSGGPAKSVVVAFGDSITDGVFSSMNKDRRWPDVLAERLAAAHRTDLAVINSGIGGNRLLSTGAGPAALARFDRDVLAIPAVRYLVLLEGINDIGFARNAHAPPPPAADLIAAYRQMIDRAHAHGITVIGATILPYLGTGYSSPEGEAVRRQVNQWLRTAGHVDRLVDLDSVMADRSAPDRLNPAYDSGDHLHPNDRGYAAMAQAVERAISGVAKAQLSPPTPF